MADDKTKLPFSDGINSIGNFLTQIGQAATQQASADIQFAETVKKEQQVVADSSAIYNQQAKQTLEDYQQIEQSRQEADSMARGDIFDRISLIGKQTLNPRDFTTEGRKMRMAEMSQGLALAGQVHNVEVVGAEARVAAAKAQQTIDTLTANAGVVATMKQIEGLQLAAQGIQATETIRELGLNKLEMPEIEHALTGPVPRNGKIALGGLEYTPLELTEQMKRLKTRQQLALLSPQATDPEFRTKMAVHHSMTLSTMNRSALDEIRKSGYRMPDGTQVEPGIWESEWSRQNALAAEEMQTKMNELTLQNQVPVMLKDTQAMFDATQTYAVPGTPLYAARTKLQAAMGTVAQVANMDQTPQGKQLQIAGLQQAQTEYAGALQKEASRRAAGSKEMENVILKQMTGQPVYPEEIGDVLRTQYTKMSNFGEILPRDMSEALRSRADKILQNKRVQASQPSNMFADQAKVSDKELREQAFNEAFETMRGQIGADSVNEVKRNFSQRKDNPAIIAGMSPMAVDGIAMQADAQAKNTIAQRYGFNEAQMLSVMNSSSQGTGKNDNEISMIIQEMNYESAAAEYALFEQKQAGLGGRMMEWYQNSLPGAVNDVEKSLPQMQRDMAGSTIRTEASVLASNYANADKAALQKGRQAVIEMASGVKKPENSWLMLLNMSSRLAEPQKQAIYYDVVMPAIKQARSQNMNDEQTSQFVFETMSQYKTDNQMLKSSINAIQRELPDLMQTFDGMWASAMLLNQPDLTQADITASDPSLANKQLKATIPWMK